MQFCRDHGSQTNAPKPDDFGTPLKYDMFECHAILEGWITDKCSKRDDFGTPPLKNDMLDCHISSASSREPLCKLASSTSLTSSTKSRKSLD
jgi:hypothetical protein